MELDEDASVIYGLEFNTRALAAQYAENDLICFFVATQSLKSDNQVHLIDFDDETCLINKHVFHHPVGEIWHISCSPNDKDIISTCYNKVSDNKAEMKAAIWRIPLIDDIQPPVSHGGPGNTQTLHKLCDLNCGNEQNMKSVLWNPSGDGSQLITLSDQYLKLWQLEDEARNVQEIDAMMLEGKGQPRFTTGAWNPHHGGSQITTANDCTIRSWDLRSMRQIFTLDNAHGQCVRDIDFNPNKQYYLVSCGDDCKVRFWDTRNLNESLMVLSDHSHWVWCVRYNHFHDQLVLSASSDSRVILNNIISLSSEPFGNLGDEEDEEGEKETKESPTPRSDGVIATYEEHEDSVYATAWSTADPWIFASLSYDGRLVINKVPRTEKYKILL